MNGAQTFIEFPINRLFLESRILAANQFAWFFDWGMYLFLLAALGVVAWIFIDSSQKRKADKALAPRIVALVGTFMVLPAFIFKFTQNADGQVIVLKLLGEPDPTQQIFTEPVRWNVQWLIGGYGPMIAIVGLVGLGIVILAGILYSTTVSRSRPDTAFVSALNN
ncbi:MAG: hypothetical protein WCP28_20500, partial [Actinomycetes bacterium]